MELTLEIYFHNNDTGRLAEMNIDFPISNCKTRPIIFLRIDAIAPYVDYDGSVHNCSITCGGFEYVCKNTVEEVLEKIHQQKMEELKALLN